MGLIATGRYTFVSFTSIQICTFLLFSLLPEIVWETLFLQKFPGGLRPLTPRQGLRPWTLLGAAPPDPCRSLLALLAAPPHA